MTADLITNSNPSLGFYTVGDKVFYSKPQALTEATKLGTDPTWHFNNEVFDSVNWAIEPEASLRELYRLRAQQLRDKYDYIRLEFSGGSNSTTALYSFVLNSIHLDEVVVRYPAISETVLRTNPFSVEPKNSLSEMRYTIQPVLEWLAKYRPNIKITIHDYSDSLLTGFVDENWVFQSNDYFYPSYIVKYNQLYDMDLVNSKKTLCVLYGIGQPMLCVHDNKWYTYFTDLHANFANSTFNDYTNITNEYFFWTPDFPELLTKQAHLIKDWFNLEQNNQFQYLVRWPNYSFSQQCAYEQLIKPIVCPDYDARTFQTVKPINRFRSETDQWFYSNFNHTQSYRHWESGLKYLLDAIDPKFVAEIKQEPSGFNRYISPMYYIGEATTTLSARIKVSNY